jgi:hypothetical protein
MDWRGTTPAIEGRCETGRRYSGLDLRQFALALASNRPVDPIAPETQAANEASTNATPTVRPKRLTDLESSPGQSDWLPRRLQESRVGPVALLSGLSNLAIKRLTGGSLGRLLGFVWADLLVLCKKSRASVLLRDRDPAAGLAGDLPLGRLDGPPGAGCLARRAIVLLELAKRPAQRGSLPTSTANAT